MDPYIEACGFWEDFHLDLIADIKRALAAGLPGHYTLQAGERAYVVLGGPDGKEGKPFQPDVVIGYTPPPAQRKSPGESSESEADADSLPMRAFIANQHRESFLEIYREGPEGYLVTRIEVLSPSNKRRGSVGWDLYLGKRRELLLGEANFVEIDLLRGGQRMPMLDPWPESPYTLLVARRERAPYCRVWRAHFQRRLPVIPVPLARPEPTAPLDADLSLDLQPLIEGIYARSRYGRHIDYTRPLTPPLTADESSWLGEQLRARQHQN
jgi:hypothetical protein